MQMMVTTVRNNHSVQILPTDRIRAALELVALQRPPAALDQIIRSTGERKRSVEGGAMGRGSPAGVASMLYVGDEKAPHEAGQK
jgi:hypothetical protein